ncbi:MAG: FAD-binding protein [Pseudomonadota bacterium]
MSTDVMEADFHPKTNEDVLAAVQWAAAEKTPLEVIGHGSRRALGKPTQTAHTLNMSGLSGVTLFEPEELVLTAKAGTPLSEITDLLDAHNQELQFEPADLGTVMGGEAGHGTLGGLINTNLCGPRRLKAGSARDHILGITAVSGRGEVFKSGGRVVKNVTGYDLSKGVTGSYGTLAVLTDITVKVLPRAETEKTLMLEGLTDEQAVEAMAMALGSSAEVSGAAHLPKSVTNGTASTLLRLEGFEPSVAYRIENLGKLLKEFGSHVQLDAETSKGQWWAVRDCLPFAANPSHPLWRISCTPTQGPQIVAAITDKTAATAFYDWQGGLIWLQMEDGDAQAELVRTELAAHGGGHATLIRATTAQRQATAVFQPQPAPLAALSERYRGNFDPHGILNPGRMG